MTPKKILVLGATGGTGQQVEDTTYIGRVARIGH